VHSAEGWEELLLPEIERPQQIVKEIAFRGDAAFARPKVYEALEARGVKYAIRIRANDTLERDIAELLPRPVGRPSQKPLIEYKGFPYQGASWKTARRVVAKVEHHAGELFPRVGFIVTNPTLQSRAVVRFYKKRGTSEQWIKEGKQAVKMTRLSCHRFRSNGAAVAEYNRLQLGEPVAAAGAIGPEKRQPQALGLSGEGECAWVVAGVPSVENPTGYAFAFTGDQGYVDGRPRIEKGNSGLKVHSKRRRPYEAQRLS
jgi:hypothetical protein